MRSYAIAVTYLVVFLLFTSFSSNRALRLSSAFNAQVAQDSLSAVASLLIGFFLVAHLVLVVVYVLLCTWMLRLFVRLAPKLVFQRVMHSVLNAHLPLALWAFVTFLFLSGLIVVIDSSEDLNRIFLIAEQSRYAAYAFAFLMSVLGASRALEVSRRGLWLGMGTPFVLLAAILSLL